MKKLILMIFLITGILFTSCEEKIDEEKFFALYKEILLIRKTNGDTAVANHLVEELYEEKAYSKEKFKNDFFELAKDPQSFARKIDSIRNEIDLNN